MSIETASDPNYATLQRQMQRLMDQMQKGFFNFCPSETWTPNVNLYENDTAYVVCVDLAGVDKEKIEVVVADQKLTLRGTRLVPTFPDPEMQAQLPAEVHPPKLRVHLMEIDHGRFARDVELPHNARADAIRATYVNGMLWIEIPKN